MSYILDALRKSELERQMASAPQARLFSPVAVESARGWREPSLIVAGVGLALVGAMLAWWTLLPGEERSASTAKARVAVVETAPAAESRVTVPNSLPERRVEPPLAPPAPVEKAVPQVAVTRTKEIAAPVTEVAKLAKASTDMKSHSAVLPTADNAESANDTLQKDFPALSIAGYIRDDQGNSLAMINEKLVREGEEVEPGVRLEKILGENSIFLYKGRRFRR